MRHQKTIAELPEALTALEAKLVIKAIAAHTNGEHPTPDAQTLPFFTAHFAAEMVAKAISAGQLQRAFGAAILAKLAPRYAKAQFTSYGHPFVLTSEASDLEWPIGGRPPQFFIEGFAEPFTFSKLEKDDEGDLFATIYKHPSGLSAEIFND